MKTTNIINRFKNFSTEDIFYLSLFLGNIAALMFILIADKEVFFKIQSYLI